MASDRNESGIMFYVHIVKKENWACLVIMEINSFVEFWI